MSYQNVIRVSSMFQVDPRVLKYEDCIRRRRDDIGEINYYGPVSGFLGSTAGRFQLNGTLWVYDNIVQNIMGKEPA